jgi:glycosyltransferase involved in cell wall biosynthesis
MTEMRARATRLQEEAMPSGSVVVSCPAPYGAGGLGRHLEEIMDALERRGEPGTCISDADLPPEREGVRVPRPAAMLAPLVRFSPAGRMWTGSVRFDERAARALPGADHLIAFNGTALAQIRAARKRGMRSASLMSANSHMRRVIRQHEIAHRQYPIERPWATRLLSRNLAEYERSDRIHVASRYVWESFTDEGFADERLSFFPLTPHPRFEQAGPRQPADTFNVVYVGSLIVHKGVPLLIDAFRRLAHPDMRLILVGGWKTRPMRRFIEQSCAEDPRITVSPGDPLAHLLAAGVCVHDSYEDGFAYAPAEALACGVPVIVSQDTGMKDLVDPGRTGVVLPTGDLRALTGAIDACYRGELLDD